MKIVDTRHIEDCFDGSYMYEVLFDADIEPAFIETLATECRLQYHRDFARPFFKAFFEDRFTLKGVQGNRTIRVLSYQKDLEPILMYLRHVMATFEYAPSGTGGQRTMQDRDVAESNIC